MLSAARESACNTILRASIPDRHSPMSTAVVPPLSFHVADFSLRERIEKEGMQWLQKWLQWAKNQGQPFGLPFS
jgi:hypothetical protein